jgi:hypothetical protein
MKLGDSKRVKVSSVVFRVKTWASAI